MLTGTRQRVIRTGKGRFAVEGMGRMGWTMVRRYDGLVGQGWMGFDMGS
jgi:hypothetical protein